MAANSRLGAALGGQGDAERLPGRPLPALVLDRLGYPPGAGAARLVSAAWRREADRLFGREREIQLALEAPHDELLAHFLNRAVRTKDVDAVRRLLATGADPDVEVWRLQTTPATQWHQSRLRWSRATPALVLACDYHRYGANNEFEVCELLLAAGADPDVAGASGQSVLYHTSHQGRTEFVRRLLAYGADPDFEPRFEAPYSHIQWGTPLSIATGFNNHDVIELLLAAGAEIGSHALHEAVANCKNGEKHSAEDGVATLRILLSHGADVDAVGPPLRRSEKTNGKTPLLRACQYGSIKGARLLLLHGAAFDRADDTGVTPLAAARELLVRPRTWEQQNREFEEDHNPPYALDGIDNGPALNAMFDRYLAWYWLRARVCVFGRSDPAQPKICSFFPHKDGRARCWRCRVDTSARDAVAGTPELSRQVAAFLVGDIASIRA